MGKDWIIFVITVIICYGLPFSFLVYLAFDYQIKVKNKEYRKLENVKYYRDIPCDGCIYKTLFLINVYKMKKFTYVPNLFSALILKFVCEDRIGIDKHNIILKNKDGFDNKIEEEVYKFLKRMAINNVVSKANLNICCKNNYSYFCKLRRKLNEYGEQKYIKENKIKKISRFGHVKYIVSQAVYEDALKLKGLQKFLEDFTITNARNIDDIHLFEEYLVFAYLFGCSDKITSQIRKIYSGIVIDNNGYFDIK